MKAMRTAVLLAVAALMLLAPLVGRSAGPFTNFAILIDQSSEMDEVYNEQSKNFIARDVAKRLLNNIPDTPGMKGAVYEYGIMAADNDNRVLRVHKWQLFERNDFLLSLDKVGRQSGPSVLSVALRKLKADMLEEPVQGWTAVFIISGGNQTDVDNAEDRAKELKQAHPETCIYTILVGKSKIGGKRLQEVEQKAKCGMQVSSDSVDKGEEVRRYISLVFSGGEAAGAGDADQDGVPDAQDKCPGTPFGAQVDVTGCWSVNNINFDSAKWDIKPMYFFELNEIAGVMNANPDLVITIKGHTDSVGTPESNKVLSDKRANSVMQYLVGADVDAGRLRSQGMGETQPIADNSTPEGKAMNRRIEFEIQRVQNAH
jgi:OmpA-OmpF porin, OOP family